MTFSERADNYKMIFVDDFGTKSRHAPDNAPQCVFYRVNVIQAARVAVIQIQSQLSCQNLHGVLQKIFVRRLIIAGIVNYRKKILRLNFLSLLAQRKEAKERAPRRGVPANFASRSVVPATARPCAVYFSQYVHFELSFSVARIVKTMSPSLFSTELSSRAL